MVTNFLVTVTKLEKIGYCYKLVLLLLWNLFNITQNVSKFCQILLVVTYVTKLFD